MKEEFKALETYINSLILVFSIIICLIVVVVNSRYLIKIDNTIDTMWHEIEQVKDTNIKLYQFIEEYKNNGS
jgi:hypothetical protein